MGSVFGVRGVARFRIAPHSYNIIQSKWDYDSWPKVERRSGRAHQMVAPISRAAQDDCGGLVCVNLSVCV